jgi:hypothetical protein
MINDFGVVILHSLTNGRISNGSVLDQFTVLVPVIYYAVCIFCVAIELIIT